MTRVSHSKLDPKDLSLILNELWEDLSFLDNPASIKTFLKPFFSPTEPIMFAKRLEILKRLRQNHSYEEIMGGLKVTPNTVSKMNNVLHLAEEEFLEILDRLIENQKKRKKRGDKKDCSRPSKSFWPVKR